MTSRWVAARATREADITASVPELTRRMRAIEGNAFGMSWPSSSSNSVGAPKDRPRRAARAMADVKAVTAWPNTEAPQEPQKSINRWPSASHTYGPWPRVIKRGVPPTPLKARTGEFTPPAKTSWDLLYKSSDFLTLIEVVSAEIVPFTPIVDNIDGKIYNHRRTTSLDTPDLQSVSKNRHDFCIFI